MIAIRWLRRALSWLRSVFWVLPVSLSLLIVTAAVSVQHLVASNVVKPLMAILARTRPSYDTAQAVLSTVAAGAMTVTSIVFSMALVAVSLVGQQMGPRLMHRLFRDRFTQLVLAVYLATFLHALIGLAGLSSVEDATNPAPAVLLSIIFGTVSILLTVGFLQRVYLSTQVDTVVASLGAHLQARILNRSNANRSAPERVDFDVDRFAWHTVAAPRHGYVAAIDISALIQAAQRTDTVVRITAAEDDFLLAGERVALVSDRALEEAVHAALSLEDERKPTAARDFDLQGIVEIAVRALSPGINDPATAIGCINHLAKFIVSALELPGTDGVHCDDDQRVRVVQRKRDFEHYCRTCFRPIVRNAAGSIGVQLRMAHLYDHLSRLVERRVHQEALRAEIDLLFAIADAEISPDAQVRDNLTQAVERLEQTRSSGS